MDKYREIQRKMKKTQASYDNAMTHIEHQEKKEETIKRIKERFIRQRDYAIMDSMKIREVAEYIYPIIANTVNMTKEEFMDKFSVLH